VISYQTAMAQSSRRTHIRATLTLLTGYAYALTGNDILSYTLNEGISGGEMLLGSAVSAHATLTLFNPNGAWQSGGEKLGERTLFGASAYIEIGVEASGSVLYEPAGTFIVSNIRIAEGENTITLSGYDRLVHSFSPAFADTLTYPCTVKHIFDAIVQQAGLVCSGTPACNADVLIAQRPDWGDGCTLRRALSFAAGAMGCFVRLNRQGTLMLLPANPQTSERALDQDQLLSLSVAPGAFCFNRVRIVPRGAQSGEYTEAALDPLLPPGADNLIILEDNALFRAGAIELPQLAQGLCTALKNLTITPFQAQISGDPTLEIGTPLLLSGLTGQAYFSLLFSQTLSYQKGLTSEIACEADTSGIALPRVLTSGGMLSSGALSEGIIASRHIKAGSVDAEKITARSITAEHIALGALTSESGVIGDLSADLVTSGKLNTDRLIVGGTEFSIVRALNQLANSLSQNDDTIDGNILSDKSISAIKVTDDFGAGLELSSNAAVLVLAGKLDGSHSHMELTESAINMVGGEINIATDDLQVRGMQDGEEIMSLDPDGLSAQRVVVRGEFSAPNVLLKSTSSTIPWKGGIQASLDAAPKWLTGYTELFVPAGTYQEDIVIRGFKGAQLGISLYQGVTINGSITIEQCDNVRIASSALGQAKIYPRDARNVISARNVGMLELNSLQISGYRQRASAQSGTATGVEMIGGVLDMSNCCVEYTRDYGVLFYMGASGTVNDCIGGLQGGDYSTNANLGYGILGSSGCHFAVLGRCPRGNTLPVSAWLSTVYGADAVTPTDGGMEYVAPTEITKTFAISKHCTYLYGVSRLRDDQSAQFGQGHYGGYATGGLNWRTGAMWFADATAELAGKTILSATLTLRRATGGFSNAVPVYLGYTPLTESNYTSTLTPSFTQSTNNYPGASISRESEMTYDVTQLMNAVKSGYAIALREPTRSYSGNYSPAYTQFYGKGSGFEPLLTVTYK